MIDLPPFIFPPSKEVAQTVLLCYFSQFKMKRQSEGKKSN